ncbi:MAG: hypothetical protein U0361_05890 [Nitrospiraceae bacterium]
MTLYLPAEDSGRLFVAPRPVQDLAGHLQRFWRKLGRSPSAWRRRGAQRAFLSCLTIRPSTMMKTVRFLQFLLRDARSMMLFMVLAGIGARFVERRVVGGDQ